MVYLDVGTNNEELLNDPNYLGKRHRRLIGPDYYDMVDEFMHHAKQYRVCAKTPTLALAVFQFLSDASNGLLKKEADAVRWASEPLN